MTEDRAYSGLETLKERNEKLEQLLLAAALQFEDYAAQHLRKKTLDGHRKAQTNIEFAKVIREILEQKS